MDKSSCRPNHDVPNATSGSGEITTSQATSSTHAETTPVASSSSTVETPRIIKAIECPVCYEPCRKPVFQCTNGHLVCNNCRARLRVCPLCKEHNRHSLRNLVAEEIGSMFLTQNLEPQPTSALPGGDAETPEPQGNTRSNSVSSGGAHSSRSESPAQSVGSGSRLSVRSASPPDNFQSRRQSTTVHTSRSQGHVSRVRPTPRRNVAPINRTRPSAYNTRASELLSATWSGRSRASAYNNNRANRIVGGNAWPGRPRHSPYSTRARRMLSGNPWLGRPRASAYNNRASRFLGDLSGPRRDIFRGVTLPESSRRSIDNTRPRRISGPSRGTTNNIGPSWMSEVEVMIEVSGNTTPAYQLFNMDIEWSDSDSNDDFAL